MNSAAIEMKPMMASNTNQQSKTTVSNSKSNFDHLLDHALSKDAESTDVNSTKTDLTNEQKLIIKDLLDFLKVNDISELQSGKSGEGDTLQQLLKNFTGEDRSTIAEILATLFDTNSSVMKVNDISELQSGKSGEDDTLQQLLKNFTGEDRSTIAEILATLFDKSSSVMKGNEQDSVNSILSKSLTEFLGSDTQNQNGSDIPSEIYGLLQKLDSLSIQDWTTQDVTKVGNLLKLAKIEDLLSSQNNLSQNEAQQQKEIKNLLASISSKLEKLVSQPNKSGNEAIFTTLLENGTNKSLDVVKQVYARIFPEGGKTDESVSNGLKIKTSETNTHSSGLPFQMTKLEQYVLTASRNGQAVDSEQFVKSFENIISKANFSNANGVQKLLIRLNPDNLGSLRIELVQKDGVMVAKILATTPQAKELLDRQVPGLKQAFMLQNIQVEKIDISQQMSTYNAERFGQRHQGQHGQHKQQQQTTQEIIEDEGTDFTDRITEALVNLKV